MGQEASAPRQVYRFFKHYVTNDKWSPAIVKLTRNQKDVEVHWLDKRTYFAGTIGMPVALVSSPHSKNNKRPSLLFYFFAAAQRVVSTLKDHCH